MKIAKNVNCQFIRYKLEQLRFNGRIKDCLGDLQKQHPEIKAVVMGTRRSDPYSCKEKFFPSFFMYF